MQFIKRQKKNNLFTWPHLTAKTLLDVQKISAGYRNRHKKLNLYMTNFGSLDPFWSWVKSSEWQFKSYKSCSAVYYSLRQSLYFISEIHLLRPARITSIAASLLLVLGLLH